MITIDLSGTDSMPDGSILLETAAQLESRCNLFAASMTDVKSA